MYTAPDRHQAQIHMDPDLRLWYAGEQDYAPNAHS